MSVHPIGVGAIGFGRRLQQVVKLLSDAAGPAVHVRHVCSRSEACRAAAAKLPDTPRVALDYTAMLDDPATPWVLVGSRNDHHREHVVSALAAGKHVFVEKPVGTTLDEVAAVAAAAAAAPDQQVVVGFVLRYAPLYRRIVQTVRGGGIGRLVSLEFNETLDFNHGGFIASDWRRHERFSGGHLLEKCSHDVDIVNWIVDAPAARTASFGGLAFFAPENAGHMARLGPDASGRPAYRGWDQREDVDPFTAEKSIVDHQVAIFEYANGVRASFHTNLNSGLPERRLVLLGTEGAIRADLNHGLIEHRRIGHDSPTTTTDQRATAGLHGGGDGPMVRALLAAMTDGTPTATPLSTGVASAVTCLAAERARATGTVVDLTPIWQQVEATA